MTYTDEKRSVYDLAIDYIKEFYTHIPSSKEKRIIIHKFMEYLSKGWTQVEIFKNLESLSDRKRFKNDCYLDKALEFYKYEKKNLISPEDIHYHNELRIFPEKKVMTIDYDKGTITHSKSEKFLEMRASYTVDNLYDYFISKEDMYSERMKDKKQYIGSFKWLLSKFEVDELLFMIDKANAHVKNGQHILKLKNPLDLKDYIEEGQKALTSKKNALVYNDADEIIPINRKGVLEKFFNARS